MSEFNILVDPLPREFEGYLIRWQFYNGILISDCLSSDDFKNDENGQIERVYTALNILFGAGIPPFEIALEGLKWFLNCTNKTNLKTSKKEEEYFSFDDDKERIFSAFMVKYGINLNEKNNLHWFEFIALMNDLRKTAFREVVDIRQMKPKDMKGFSKEQKAEIMRQKKLFKIKKTLDVNSYTQEQIDKIDSFDKRFLENKIG
jgi:hypothetical protein